jgi:hypothetical protein
MTPASFEKKIKYYEKHEEEFQEIVVAYLWEKLPEEDEILLSKLIKSSSLLEKKFIELSKLNQILEESKKREILKLPFLDYNSKLLYAAAGILLLFLVSYFFRKEDKTTHLTLTNSTPIELIRKLGDCRITKIEGGSVELETKKHSVCDFQMENKRSQRIRLFPNSRAYVSLTGKAWKVTIVSGKHYITTIKSDPSEDLLVNMDKKRWIQFIGTSVYISKKKEIHFKITDGQVRLIEQNEEQKPEIMDTVNAGSSVLLLSENHYKKSKIDKKEFSDMKQVFIALKADLKQKPNIDIDQVFSKKVQEIPGNHVILNNGDSFDLDTIWQEDDMYIMNLKGELKTFSKSEIKKIQF